MATNFVLRKLYREAFLHSTAFSVQPFLASKFWVNKVKPFAHSVVLARLFLARADEQHRLVSKLLHDRHSLFGC